MEILYVITLIILGISFMLWKKKDEKIPSHLTELYFFTISAPPDEEAEWSHFLLTMEGGPRKSPLS